MTTDKNSGWQFDNSYARLPKSFFSGVKPNQVSSPKLVKLNEALAESLGLNAEELKSEENVQVFAGNDVPAGAFPLAQAYAGHQFGHFTMLGDGRAMLIGEQITPDGKRFDIQLKGSGRTPFSRGGDGRAALGPMLREYIISEAMHGLGIPTTRSLAVVTTGESIIRETMLPGAILTRTASSHLRVGTFQYAAGRENTEELRVLADYAINRHYPQIEGNDNRYLSFLKEVIKRQAALIAKWQLIGFIHGVMNTDNMTISGETIDYGPCAFMDTYHLDTVFSSIDSQGRYAYGNQPRIGGWNLARLAEALMPLLHDNEEKALEIAQEAMYEYAPQYESNWHTGMRAKLGLVKEEKEDEKLIEDLLGMMQKYQADFTNTFKVLTFGKFEDAAMNGKPEFVEWLKNWQQRRSREEQSMEDAQALMKRSNPAFIPRNHRVEEALAAAVEHGDYQVMERLLQMLANPFAHMPEQEAYCTPPSASQQPYRTYCGT